MQLLITQISATDKMNTLIADSNLSHIGSKEDRAAKNAAAEIEVNWDGVGMEIGIKIWRVENKNENGVAKFGINPWPMNLYGDFYTGDSYIVLSTSKDDSESLLYDIFFWIGSESSTDEYGVAAYKANELDDLLGDAPVQHREVQYNESNQFMSLFDRQGGVGMKYLDGGIDGGFRHVREKDESILPNRLFHIRRVNRRIRCLQVPVKCDSLNQGDTFVLDAGSVIYTWFGAESSPFEKSKAGTIAHNLANSIGRKGVRQESDVEDENEAFWNLLDGKEEIKESEEFDDFDLPQIEEPKMYILNDDNNELTVESITPAEQSSLNSDDVCLITGKSVFVWVGKGSTKREQQEAMRMTQTFLKSVEKNNGESLNVVRILEGQEHRIPDWPFN